MRSELSVNTIFIIFISLISIMLLVSLFSTKFRAVPEKIYCYTLYKLRAPDPNSVCETHYELGVNRILPEKKTISEFHADRTYRTLRSDESFNATILVPQGQVIRAEFEVDAGMVPEVYLDRVPVDQDFTATLEDSMRSCDDPCNLTFQVIGEGIIHDLNITIEKCFVLENIVASMLSCKELTQGLSKDILCDELILSRTCREDGMITENELTEFLMENNLCDEVGTGGACGTDIVDWNLQNRNANLLVEYSDGKIRVS